MIYPQKLSAKKTNFINTFAIIISIVVAILLYILNRKYTPELHWAEICMGGIIYIWGIFIYSIKRNNNIAYQVLIHLIFLSALLFFIDKTTNSNGWSVNLVIPILIIFANITMLIITIANRRKYFQYATCQLLIILFSMLPLFFVYEHISNNKTLCIIASSISLVNFIVSLLLNPQDIKETIIRKLHM